MSVNRINLFILTIFLATALQAQEEVVIRKKEFKSTDNSEGFKEAWKSVKEGNTYFEEGLGTYTLARDHYLFANQYNGYNAELNYRIGVCYLFSDDKFRAIDFFLKAYELKTDVSSDIRLMVGKAYHQAEEFDKARQFYLEYKQNLTIDDDILMKNNEVEKLLIECTHGKELSREPKRVIIQNLGEAVNSVYDDYNARFAYNDTALIFTSRRPMDKRAKRNELDNKYYENIFISSYSGGKFMGARELGKPFNARGNYSIVGIAPDGSSLFVYDGSSNGGDILQAFYLHEKGKWKKPKALSKKIRTDASETTAALSPDGNELYFVSSNPEMTNGGKDIFVTRLNAKGKWDVPRNLGGLINSKYDEEGIYLTNDGNTLYFASKGHNSMGGFDIFKAVKDEDGSWGAPENLGYPINTPEDEVFYVTDSAGVYGYYSTIREGGFGGKDIYKVIALGAEKDVLTLTKDKLIVGMDYLERDPHLTTPELLNIDTTLMLSGQVRDTVGDADTLVMAALSFMDPATGEVVARAMTGTDGYYRARIPEPKVYGLEINATGYLYYLDILDLSDLNPDEPAEKDFFLQRIEVGTKVVLDNIYFETGKSVLTSSSYESLNQVVRFLTNNESVRLEISGHTDNTGSLRINTNLSEARAKAVVDYVVGGGIPASRLEYKGYADSQPVAPNDTREGREMNRRVEFKVLSK
ncbi:MAG: OmpA family protein [Bacteroidales bacterium]